MWETLSIPWQAAIEEAWSAYCAGSVPIGAVIVNAAGEIMARGRNRVGDAGAGPVHSHELAHAELNALLALDANRETRHGCTLYTTCEPCLLCLGAFYMSGVRGLRYASRDPFAGSVNLLGTTPYLSRKPVRVHGPERADLENVLAALHTEAALRDYGERSRPVLDAWRVVMPEGVRLGEQAFQTGRLRQLREAAAAVTEVVTQLEKRLRIGNGYCNGCNG